MLRHGDEFIKDTPATGKLSIKSAKFIREF